MIEVSLSLIQQEVIIISLKICLHWLLRRTVVVNFDDLCSLPMKRKCPFSIKLWKTKNLDGIQGRGTFQSLMHPVRQSVCHFVCPAHFSMEHILQSIEGITMKMHIVIEGIKEKCSAHDSKLFLSSLQSICSLSKHFIWIISHKY